MPEDELTWRAGIMMRGLAAFSGRLGKARAPSNRVGGPGTSARDLSDRPESEHGKAAGREGKLSGLDEAGVPPGGELDRPHGYTRSPACGMPLSPEALPGADSALRRRGNLGWFRGLLAGVGLARAETRVAGFLAGCRCSALPILLRMGRFNLVGYCGAWT